MCIPYSPQEKHPFNQSVRSPLSIPSLQKAAFHLLVLFNLIPYLIGLGPAGAAAITGEYGNISDIFERSNGLTRRVYCIVEY